MSEPGAVRAVGVLIPAHDEVEHVESCLDAVAVALERLQRDVATAVCLVDDRSRDGTTPVARRWAAGRGFRPHLDVTVNRTLVPIGVLRNQAARRVLHRLEAVPPQAIRLLSTDADSRVPPDWAVRHVELAGSGADAVSGGVLPDGPVPPDVLVPDGVYAANLGVGAGPFRQVDGFPSVHSGEDVRLLRRLRAAGHHVLSSARIYVRTSARTRGRAIGGLADRLRARTDTPVVPDPA